MGIPSYFSYIIKNHSNIIRSLQYHQDIAHTAFECLYMDCNSIIYDSFRDIEKKNKIIFNTPGGKYAHDCIDAIFIKIVEEDFGIDLKKDWLKPYIEDVIEPYIDNIS